MKRQRNVSETKQMQHKQQLTTGIGRRLCVRICTQISAGERPAHGRFRTSISHSVTPNEKTSLAKLNRFFPGSPINAEKNKQNEEEKCSENDKQTARTNLQATPTRQDRDRSSCTFCLKNSRC